MTITIKAQRRELFGTNAAGRLRRQGLVPAILYGGRAESVPLVLEKKDLFRLMRSESGENTLFRVAFDGEERDSMIKELQVNPVTDEILHADIIQIAMDKAIRVTVPIVHSGEPVGVKVEGGFVDFVSREVEIECLPGAIPESFAIDISGLHAHQTFKVGDIVPPAGVRILTDPGTVLVLISMPHKEEEVKGEVPEEAMAETKEPEVIKKERTEKEAAGEKDKGAKDKGAKEKGEKEKGAKDKGAKEK